MAYLSITHPVRHAAPRSFGWKTVAHWVAVSRERRSLCGLTHTQLMDIGITTRAADAEARRPFWAAERR